MNPWIAIAGWTLIHFIWQGALIAAVAAVLLRLARNAPPQWRHAIACIGLALMTAAPVLTAVLLARGATAPPLAAPGLTMHAAPTFTVAPHSVAQAAIAQTHWWGGIDVAAVLPFLVLAWAAGVLVLFVRLALGWKRIHDVHRMALRAAPSSWQATADRIILRLGLRRVVRVVDSLAVDTPAVIGWLRPVVLLPIATLAQLTEEQVAAVLVHELAHIRRHDLLVNLCQAAAETLLFYHPAVWWLSSRIRIEREHCCDDVAVQFAGDPVLYAEALTALAAGVLAPAPLVLAANGGSLLDRVRRVLGAERTAVQRRPAGAAVALVTAAIVVTGGLTVYLRAQVPDVMRYAHAGGPGQGLGPADVNRLVGYQLFPARRALPTDDPLDARAWDVTIKSPGGEMPFIGFTGRSLIRYAYDGGAMPVVDVPDWVDTQSITLTVEAPSAKADEAALRAAVRTALEQQLQLVVGRDSRDFDAYALVLADNGLGPRIHPTTSTCVDGHDLAAIAGARRRTWEATLMCGADNDLTGQTGRRVTMAQVAASLRQPWLDRQVIDRTGFTAAVDYRLDVGLVPLAVIATAHPELAPVLAPLGVTPMARALEEQLGLRLEAAKVAFEVLVVERVDQP